MWYGIILGFFRYGYTHSIAQLPKLTIMSELANSRLVLVIKIGSLSETVITVQVRYVLILMSRI